MEYWLVEAEGRTDEQDGETGLILCLSEAQVCF
jgi:hypothetical protein